MLISQVDQDPEESLVQHFHMFWLKSLVCCVLPQDKSKYASVKGLGDSNRCSPISNIFQPCSVYVFTEAGEGG